MTDVLETVGRFARSTVLLRMLGLVSAGVYAACIVWVHAVQPRTVAEVRGGVAATVGAYTIDRPAFDDGLRAFRADQFPEARRAFGRADPAGRDPMTQYYVAYSYLREGWGRFYEDDALYQQGAAALQRAVAASPGGVVTVDDPDLTLKSSDALAEAFARGQRREPADFNPLRVLGRRP